MDTLHKLLDDGIRYDPHYLPSMNADHMPMTLCALSAFGADDDALYAYRDDYSKILREVPQAEPVADWHDGLGNMDSYPGLLAYFKDRITGDGTAPVVAEVLARCLPALAAEAFHPIIRLGYAVDFESEAETAAALAYLVSSTCEVPFDTTRPIDLGSTLREQAAHPVKIKSSRFGVALQQLLDQDAWPTGKAASLEECAARSLEVYRGTRNFFALHMVTATQAARVCSTFVDDETMRACLTGALLGAHRIVGSPAFDADRPAPAPDALDREHIYKYIYACMSEHRVYGDPRYLDEIRAFRGKGLIEEWMAHT